MWRFNMLSKFGAKVGGGEGNQRWPECQEDTGTPAMALQAAGGTAGPPTATLSCHIQQRRASGTDPRGAHGRLRKGSGWKHVSASRRDPQTLGACGRSNEQPGLGQSRNLSCSHQSPWAPLSHLTLLTTVSPGNSEKHSPVILQVKGNPTSLFLLTTPP